MCTLGALPFRWIPLVAVMLSRCNITTPRLSADILTGAGLHRISKLKLFVGQFLIGHALSETSHNASQHHAISIHAARLVSC